MLLLLTWLLQWNSLIAFCFQISGMALSGDENKNERSKWSTYALTLRRILVTMKIQKEEKKKKRKTQTNPI